MVVVIFKIQNYTVYIAKSHKLEAILHAFYENCDTISHTTLFSNLIHTFTLFHDLWESLANQKERQLEKKMAMTFFFSLYLICILYVFLLDNTKWKEKEKRNWCARVEYDFLLINYAQLNELYTGKYLIDSVRSFFHLNFFVAAFVWSNTAVLPKLYSTCARECARVCKFFCLLHLFGSNWIMGVFLLVLSNYSY